MENAGIARLLTKSISVLLVLAFLFVVLRFYCKSRYNRRFGWDDYLLAGAWVIPMTPLFLPCFFLLLFSSTWAKVY